MPPPLTQKETSVGLYIELFTNIYAEKIENMVNDFKMNRCVLDFDSRFIGFLVK